MDSTDIEIRLWRDNQPCEPMIPRYTPADWFECDFLAVTKAGYAREFEIKLTRSDFLADFKKSSVRNGSPFGAKSEKKHDRLASGDCFPNYYWFVCPEGVIDEHEVPPYAGLKYALERDGVIILKTVVKAPRLHGRKVSEQELRRLGRTFGFRYWDLKENLQRLKREKEEAKDPNIALQRKYHNRLFKIQDIRRKLDYMEEDIRRYFVDLDSSGFTDFDRRIIKAKRERMRNDQSYARDQRCMVRQKVAELRKGRKKLAGLERLEAEDRKKLNDLGIGIW